MEPLPFTAAPQNFLPTGTRPIMPLNDLLTSSSNSTRRILEGCLEGNLLTPDDALQLFSVTGVELHALCLSADHLRQEQCGDTVSYVINRNINFTNVCIKSCKFCAFARGIRSEEGYMLSPEQILIKTSEAVEMGATEICLQAGLAPISNPHFYRNLLETIKSEYPDLHIHAFSPEEIKYGASLTGQSISDYLADLQSAGLGSLPGTSAEILDDTLRKKIAPGRITTAQWIDVIRNAHELGIPTTSTMMFGHVETLEQRIAHMELLRALQEETGGFTEFVPLSFVHQESPLFVTRTVLGVQPGPSGNDVIRLYAISRLMLGASMKNIQASWVKEGRRQSQWLLSCGVNDLGGTLINESISTTAGAQHGQLVTPAAIRRLIRDAGRTPLQRNTTYEVLKEFPQILSIEEEAQEAANEPLNTIDPNSKLFGSYQELVANESLRYDFQRPKKRSGQVSSDLNSSKSIGRSTSKPN